MMTVTILLIFVGSFVLYSTSQKAKLQQRFEIERLLQNNPRGSKLIGLSLLFFALGVSIFKLGITSGILFWLFVLTMMLSLLVLVYPLHKINYKHLFVLLVASILIEIFS